MHTVTIRHNFEAAHRLFTQPGKCHGLHGHSFWAEVTIGSDGLDERYMVVEFGELKAAVRSFLDDLWDHAALLHRDDPLASILEDHGSKVGRFSSDPTTEALSWFLSDQVAQMLAGIEGGEHCYVASVVVQETAVNGAGWHR